MTRSMLAPMIAGQSATDTTLTLRFRLGDPLGLIDVETEMAGQLSHAGYLALVRETASRLELYAHDYEAALSSEAQLTLGTPQLPPHAPDQLCNCEDCEEARYPGHKARLHEGEQIARAAQERLEMRPSIEHAVRCGAV